MNKDFSVDELVEIRCDLSYAMQKIDKIIVARLSARHRDRNPGDYTIDDFVTAEKEIAVATTQLQCVSDKMLPAIMAIAQEAVPV